MLIVIFTRQLKSKLDKNCTFLEKLLQYDLFSRPRQSQRLL